MKVLDRLGRLGLWILFVSVHVRLLPHITGSELDDLHYVRSAMSIVAGDWLGPYSSTTLIAGPGFPLYLAFLNLLGWPYLMAQAVFYILSGLAILHGLKANGLVIKYQIPFWLAFLLIPILYSSQYLTVYRTGFYVILTNMLVGAALVLRANLHVKPLTTALSRYTGAAVFSSILGLYWITREESIWILPGLLLAVSPWLLEIVTAFHTSSRFAKLALVGPFCLAVILACAPTQIVKALNQSKYGVSDIVEFDERSYRYAYSEITRVVDSAAPRLVPTSKSSLQAILEAGPASRAIAENIDLAAWSKFGCEGFRIDPCDGEIRGAWLAWAIRDSARRLGLFEDPDRVRNHFQSVGDEIRGACQSGALLCDPARTSFASRLKADDFSYVYESHFRLGKVFLDMSVIDVRFVSLPNSVKDISSVLDFLSLKETAYLNSEVQAFSRNLSDFLEKIRPFWFYFLVLGLIFHLICYFLKNVEAPPTRRILEILLLLIASRIELLAIVDATFIPAATIAYLAPAYPLAAVYSYLGFRNLGLNLFTGIRYVRKRIW